MSYLFSLPTNFVNQLSFITPLASRTSSEDDTSDESTASPSVYAGETAAGTAAAESAAADAAAAVSATEASRVQLQHSSRLHQQSPADPSLDDSLRSDANAAKCPAAAPAASDSLSEYCLNGILVVRVLLLITAATTAVHTPRKQAPGCNCNLCRWANQVNSLTAGSIFHPLPIYSSTEGSWLAKQLTTELASQLASELGSMPARR